MKIKEHNIETGEIVERDATEQEIYDAEMLAAEIETKRIKAAEAIVAKAALLEKLGITQEEAKLLLS